MQRITDKNLQAVVDRINRETGSPMLSYDAPKTEAEHAMYRGGKVAQIGNYHLYHAYGGVALHRMVSNGGGVEDVLRMGCVPKRELYNAMHAFLAGLDAARAD